jgi:hypothetical protein
MALERTQVHKRKTHREESSIPNDVADAAEQGKLFIPLEQRLDDDEIPDGFMQQSIMLGRDQYIALLPERIMKYIGFPDEATDELYECYQEIRHFENEQIKKKNLNAAESYFAHNVKQSYETYVLNQLLEGGGKLRKDYETVFSKEKKTIEALLSVLGCKTSHSLKELDDVLVHRSPVQVRMVQQVVTKKPREEDVYETKTVRERVQCYVGSHYEWRTETRTHRHKVGTRTVYDAIVENQVVEKDMVVDRVRQYHELEHEAVDKLKLGNGNGKDPNIGVNMLRTYLNMHLEKDGKTRLPMETDGLFAGDEQA